MWDVLRKAPLFAGMKETVAEQVLAELNARCVEYGNGDTIYREGETVTDLALIIKGSVCIENTTYWGNKTIMDKVGAGNVFCESYACLPDQPILVRAVAAEKTRVLLINVSAIMDAPKEEAFDLLRRNLLRVTAQKNLDLSRKIFHMAEKSVRGRICSYLSHRAACENTDAFAVPFNRQQMAEYLNIDRSSLSGELARMQREGLLRVRKNRFELKKKLVKE